MRYELMLPHQIRKAIKENWPVVLPLGVLEYHGEHLAVGLDTLVVVKALEMLEKEIDLVILPPFYYGASSYAVEPPEGSGSVHVERREAVSLRAGDVPRACCASASATSTVFIHHQTENFAAGMPTDLAFKFAARQTIFEFLEKERGEGWWGNPKMANYYAKQATGDDPFNWIKAHPLLNAEAIRQYPFDHAGHGRDVAADGASVPKAWT